MKIGRRAKGDVEISALMKSDLPVIILAAGGSTRMRGRDKCLEPVEGQPLVARQARLARSVTSGKVIVALPPRPHPRYEALAGLDVTPLPVENAHLGKGASLRVAFAALPWGTPAAMLMLADMPALTQNDLKNILQAVDIKSKYLIWRATDTAGKPGHPIVFAAALFPIFATLRGDSGGRDVIAQAKDKVVLIALPDSNARLDLDTPEDWAAWRAERK